MKVHIKDPEVVHFIPVKAVFLLYQSYNNFYLLGKVRIDQSITALIQILSTEKTLNSALPGVCLKLAHAAKYDDKVYPEPGLKGRIIEVRFWLFLNRNIFYIIVVPHLYK